MDEKIRKLKELIEDYEDKLKDLQDMQTQWDEFYDPGSDPGLQFEQEFRVDMAYDLIAKYSKTL